GEPIPLHFDFQSGASTENRLSPFSFLSLISGALLLNSASTLENKAVPIASPLFFLSWSRCQLTKEDCDEEVFSLASQLDSLLKEGMNLDGERFERFV